jgi:hypothetical protein
MKDPIVMKNQQTYERAAIEEYLKCNNGSAPLTGEKLSIADGIPNSSLKNSIKQAAFTPFSVTVKYDSEYEQRKAQVQISMWDTIDALKAAIAKATQIPISDQTIVVDGINAGDGESIEECGIDGKTPVEVKCNPIIVSVTGSKTLGVTIYLFETLLDLKKKVEKKERVFLGNNKYTPGMGKP